LTWFSLAHTIARIAATSTERVVIQGASFGRLVSVVDLEIDVASGVLRGRTRARNVPVPNGHDGDACLAIAAYPPLPPDARRSGRSLRTIGSARHRSPTRRSRRIAEAFDRRRRQAATMRWGA
jgi:hypothetical protein